MLIRVFLISFFLSLPFWWGLNFWEKNLSDFFFWEEISQNPKIFTAQVVLEERLRDLKPIRKKAEDLDLGAKSAISVFINDQGEERILFEKNINQKLPIASLTKVMTAFVVLENYDLAKEIKISKEAVSQEGNFGKLIAGRTFEVKYLLYPLLMESSNDAALALADDYGEMTEKAFVELMNLAAQKMELKNTLFVNSTGLDDEKTKKINYSTAVELVALTKELLKKPLIWQILSTKQFDLYGPELINTNELLFDSSINWQDRIIGGKTGYTEKAGGCMILVVRAPKNKGYLINIILGTNGTTDRFEEMRKLVNWLDSSYKW